jgi:hypothetical protein
LFVVGKRTEIGWGGMDWVHLAFGQEPVAVSHEPSVFIKFRRILE